MRRIVNCSEVVGAVEVPAHRLLRTVKHRFQNCGSHKNKCRDAGESILAQVKYTDEGKACITPDDFSAILDIEILLARNQSKVHPLHLRPAMLPPPSGRRQSVQARDVGGIRRIKAPSSTRYTYAYNCEVPLTNDMSEPYYVCAELVCIYTGGWGPQYYPILHNQCCQNAWFWPWYGEAFCVRNGSFI